MASRGGGMGFWGVVGAIIVAMLICCLLQMYKFKSKNTFDIILVLITAFLYLLNNFIFKKYSSGIFYYFFVCYFNDLICPIGFLAYVNIMLSFVNKNIEKLYQLLSFCFLCGLVWEFITPLMKDSSVTDFFDLLCYCVGGVLYWIIKKDVKGEKT